MELAIQLYGYLILTLLGFITPILAILLSLYSRGISQLSKEYQEEKSRAEAQIRELAKSEKTDIKEIESSINKLKKIGQTTKQKLAYLQPKAQIINLFALLLTSFLCVICALLDAKILWASISFILISFLLLICGIYILYEMLLVFVEVKKIADTQKEEDKAKIVDLLSAIVERTDKGGMLFLHNVAITIDGIKFKDDKQSIDIEINKSQGFSIGFSNTENRMVKNLEIGLVFTNDFIIQKSSDDYSIYSNKTQQIIRFKKDFIQGDTHYIFGTLNITALKLGDYIVENFVKAENIEVIKGSFKLKVTAKSTEGVKQ